MIRTALVGAAALTLLAGVGLTSYHAGSSAAPSMTLVAQPEGEMGMDAMMKMMQKAATPGKHHAKLAANAGDWKAHTKFSMGPGEASEGEGVMSLETILGGRFTLGRYTGGFAGMDFEGVSITGYDNAKKQYVSVWADSFGTSILYMTGNMEGDELVLTGMAAGPMGEHEMKIVSAQPDANTMIDTFYDKYADEWVQSGQITYTRTGQGEHDKHNEHGKQGGMGGMGSRGG